MTQFTAAGSSLVTARFVMFVTVISTLPRWHLVARSNRKWMAPMLQYSPKTPDDREFLTMDFAPRLKPGVTISTAEVKVDPISGCDANAADMIDSVVVVAGTIVGVWINRGVAGVTYVVSFLVNRSDAGESESQGLLPVQEYI